MTIQQFIEAGIKGEWKPTDIWSLNVIPFDLTGNLSAQVRDHGFIYRWILEPELWKAVGKFKDEQMQQHAVANGIFISSERWIWEAYMMQMMINIIHGKTLEEYIATL